MPTNNPYGYATPWVQPTGWDRSRFFTQPNPEVGWHQYPSMGSLIPSFYDPRILLAGRQTPGSAMSDNSRPQGLLWQSAANWISRMPALVGR